MYDMKVLLVNIDSKIPNLALEKLRVYYEERDAKVYQMKDKSILPFTDVYDKIYVSCVFDYNKHRCKKWEGVAEIGGSGYSLKKCLPSKIDRIKPKINLGFATRGCIRNCPFCIVPTKEGRIRIVGDVYDLWNRQGQDIVFMDNNILAAPDHFFKICKQLKKEKLKVDFNQGLDHRLLTGRICKELFSLRLITTHHVRLRFAFDHISYKESVLKALKMLKKHGLKHHQTRWYIYVGIDDTMKTVLDRINILRDAGQLVFVMRDRKVQSNPEFRKIYAWACAVATYVKFNYVEYTRDERQFVDERPILF